MDNYEFIEPRLIEYCNYAEELEPYCKPDIFLKMRKFFIFNLALDKTKALLDKKISKEKDIEKLSIMLFSRAFTSYLKERFFEFKNIKKDVLKVQKLGFSKEKIKNIFGFSDEFLEAFLISKFIF
ncbi:hypothetical protein B6S12_02985 [Helicobacter valdiviensis]|uniref:Uncharacterized protein n=1 Tax=Helicobacter valdiviensis TaxID=1458358 RepID=A0A2W6NIC7_9HELI|nr:hypothetical protein [Helicobacter valdiviensis]PZT48620.1 hypothetical protein B6S12_02985 [Helicobacter valdiviensis]